MSPNRLQKGACVSNIDDFANILRFVDPLARFRAGLRYQSVRYSWRIGPVNSETILSADGRNLCVSEPTQGSITGLKLMVLGIQVALFARFLFQSLLLMVLGGVLTVIGLVVR